LDYFDKYRFEFLQLNGTLPLVQHIPGPIKQKEYRGQAVVQQ
jgi:hypothetical protein